MYKGFSRWLWVGNFIIYIVIYIDLDNSGNPLYVSLTLDPVTQASWRRNPIGSHWYSSTMEDLMLAVSTYVDLGNDGSRVLSLDSFTSLFYSEEDCQGMPDIGGRRIASALSSFGSGTFSPPWNSGIRDSITCKPLRRCVCLDSNALHMLIYPDHVVVGHGSWARCSTVSVFWWFGPC